jgi:hypothetical protein
LPVVGLAATNQAVAQLCDAGVPATTIARFRLAGARLAPGSVVVLDEVSQVATADAEIILAAVAATPGARLWCLGDPHQAQPVRAGGLGDEIARLGQQGRIPAPALTVNRRQEDPAEQTALARYRSGLVATSQAIRLDHGWEHDLGSPHATREGLADAVAADIHRHGPAQVIALAISHADCEDLADRIRARLRADGSIDGPEVVGPAWSDARERHYAAGDRVLLHGVLHTAGRRLHNGTVLTVTAVDSTGLEAVDVHGTPMVVPLSFVAGRRTDGSPNCSHAWARTVDGIQGGTWTQVHLLGNAALARTTGYVGQSRSRRPTHTWNVRPVPDVDVGGVPADERTAERVVLDALRHQADTGFAVHDTPTRIEQLRTERRELRALLQYQPVDPQPSFRQAEQALVSAKNRLDGARYRLDTARQHLEDLGPLSQLRRHGRKDKASTLDRIETFTHQVDQAEDEVVRRGQALEELRPELDQRRHWDQQHGWPADRLRSVEAELTELEGPPDLWRDAGALRQAPGVGHRPWRDRPADGAGPALPGHDTGAGIDLGF